MKSDVVVSWFWIVAFKEDDVGILVLVMEWL